MRCVGGFLTCNDWNVENIWQLTCVKPIPDRYDFYCMPFVFRHIVRSPCYQQQVFTFQFLCRLQGFQFPLTGLGVRDIIRPLFEESSNDLANTNPLSVVIGKRYFSFSIFIVLHRKFKVVCQEHEFTTLFLIKINHSSECSWVIFTTLIDDKLNGRVG